MDLEIFLVLYILWLLIVLLFADAITYGMAKVVEHQTGANETVDYFIAGMRCQPLQAFAFMLDLPELRDDTLKLLPYSQRRAHFSKMTDAILQDIAEHHYQKVRVFAISVGATVPYFLGQRMAMHPERYEFELECHLINPCQAAQFLKPKVRKRLWVGYPLMIVLVAIMGPLAFVPIIPGGGKHFSVALTVRQVEQILFGGPISREHRRYVKTVLLSGSDGLLENQSIHAFYAQQNPVYLGGVEHSDTIGATTKYRAAIKQALAGPRSS